MEFLRLVPMHVREMSEKDSSCSSDSGNIFPPILHIPQIHVYLAESPFRHRLRQSTVLKILTLYPMLPNSLSDKGLRYNSKYTT